MAKAPCRTNVTMYSADCDTALVLSLICYCAQLFYAPSVATKFKTFARWCWERRWRHSRRSFVFRKTHPRSRGIHMPNPGQPTISQGATGDAVRRLQRALRRTPNLGLVVDGVFGPVTEAAVKAFQQGAGLAVDGIVGPNTWGALPGGGAMPTLYQGSRGNVVSSLQQVLTNGAPGQWATTPQGVDGVFGPNT